MNAEIWKTATGVFMVLLDVEVVEASALVSLGACVVTSKEVDDEAAAVEWFGEWVRERQPDAARTRVPKRELEKKALRAVLSGLEGSEGEIPK